MVEECRRHSMDSAIRGEVEPSLWLLQLRQLSSAQTSNFEHDATCFETVHTATTAISVWPKEIFAGRSISNSGRPSSSTTFRQYPSATTGSTSSKKCLVQKTSVRSQAAYSAHQGRRRSRRHSGIDRCFWQRCCLLCWGRFEGAQGHDSG